MATQTPVRVSFEDLKTRPEALATQIQQAFGSEEGCLGVILIEDLPEGFVGLREKLFHLSHAFANLPVNVRESLSRPETSYSFGWSHGKEVMNGRPDTQKGSYYANPLVDHPDVSAEKKREHPEYYDGNVWPRHIAGLEQYEATFKALGALIFEVGCALARACETFVSSSIATSSKVTIETLIARSQCNKARLLHYFPEEVVEAGGGDQLANDALCGTHKDHSILTGLCSAMYLSTKNGESPEMVSAPTPTAGLWIYPRSAASSSKPEAVKVAIPPNCLAFQTGEALELLTSNKLAATPHFVSGSSGSSPDSAYISRETFAFFLQPDVDEIISPERETFGQFTKRVLGRHYQDQAFKEAED